MNLIFPTTMVFHFRKKLCKIILDRSRSLYKFLSFILPWYSNRFRWNAPRGFAKPLFPFHQRSFPSRSRSEREVRSFTMIGPSGLYPSLQRKLTQTERVSFLLLAALISLHLFRAVRAASVLLLTLPSFFDHFPTLTLERFPRFTDSPLYPSLHRLPLCSRAPAISYRNLSCAPKHFSENRLARAVAGQSPKCWRSRSSPGEDRSTISPTYPARYVRMYVHLLHLRLETFLPSVEIKRSRSLSSKANADWFEINVFFIGQMFLCSYLSLNNFLSSILTLDKKEIKIKDNRNKEIFVYLNLILFNCYFVN